MNFITLAADTANTASGAAQQVSPLSSILGMLLPLALFVVVIYFVMIRPQRKKQKAEDKMRNELQAGDEIITIGGIYGRVVSVKEDSLIIESSMDRSKIQISRSAVAQNLTVHDA